MAAQHGVVNLATMSTPPVDDELALFACWRGGDARAGALLAQRYHAALCQFFRTKARPEAVDDLAQQVWVALSEKPGANAIQTSVRAYIFGIARHVLFAHLRARYRAGVEDPLSSSIAALDPSLSRAVDVRIQAQRLIQALQSLPVDMQILLELRYDSQLSTRELAGMYGVPPGTIKSRLFHARRLLEAELGGR